MRRILLALVALPGVVVAQASMHPDFRHQADVVVYGGTASGVMTAYSAAQDGAKVILLEPGSHLGGMVTGGLSATDLGHFQIIGGYAREFYMEAAAHYGVHGLSKPENWLSEPHVDEAIFREWMERAHVQVVFHERLREKAGVSVAGEKVTALTTEDGQGWIGKVFVDCSYEGDLMAQAGVRYTVGRESAETYGESLAGVRTETPKHQFLWAVPAYDAGHRLFPYVDAGPMGAQGSEDKKVQAYNFRLILTDDATNRVEWAKPEGYYAGKFALLAEYLKHFEEHAGHAVTIRDVMNPVAIPEHKADFNNNGPFSTDFIGKSWSYPDASYAERRRIWKEHLVYTQSFLYFLATDARVPKSLHEDMQRWGLAKDEFPDTGHWPNQMYIREGRRMVGVYVMKQADLQTELTKADSIGMGSYNSDSHNIQRVAMADGTVRNEGDVQVHVEPYEIAYRAIVPGVGQVGNLLVPVCLSASHVAYSSVRMEPQYMIIGQAAGSAAVLAMRGDGVVRDVNVAELQRKLREHGAILHLEEQAK